MKMKNKLDNIDDVAMQELHKQEKTKLSYEEWLAKQLVNYHMGKRNLLCLLVKT